MYNDRVARYIAEYFIELNGKVDAIVFTAGVGENGIEAREDIINRVSALGIKIDKKANDNVAGYRDNQEGIISSKDSKVDVWVVPTNEELMIIKDTYKVICGK